MSTTPWYTRGPLVVEGLLPPTLCDKLLDHFTSSTPKERSYQGVVDHDLRDCTYVALLDDLTAEVLEAVDQPVRDYFDVDSTPVPDQPLLIYRYGEGVGFVSHHDGVTEVELERARTNGQPVIGGDLTTVFFLSGPDDYDGGALYFQDPAVELRPPRGSLVSFPATESFIHGVRPVTGGARFTLLARRLVAVR